MPEICRFLGISIRMYFNDHPPPHFHVQYNELRAKVEVESLRTLEGRLPPRVAGLVREWAEMHTGELLENWQSLRRTGSSRRSLRSHRDRQEVVMTWVESAEHAGEYRLHLRFNDGMQGTVDLRQVIFDDPRPIFQEARDPEVFRRFRVDLDTVVWEHGLDLAPEFLYEMVLAPAEAFERR